VEGTGEQVRNTQPRVVELEGGLALDAYPPPVQGEVERAPAEPAAAAEGEVKPTAIALPPPVEEENEQSPQLPTPPVVQVDRVPGAPLSSIKGVPGGEERRLLSRQPKNLRDKTVKEQRQCQNTESPNSQAPRQVK